MRYNAALVLLSLLMATGCANYNSAEDNRRARERERVEHPGHEPVARKAGSAAYEITQETKKAAKALGRELSHAGHDAHEGWRDAKEKRRAEPDR